MFDREGTSMSGFLMQELDRYVRLHQTGKPQQQTGLTHYLQAGKRKNARARMVASIYFLPNGVCLVPLFR